MEPQVYGFETVGGEDGKDSLQLARALHGAGQQRGGGVAHQGELGDASPEHRSDPTVDAELIAFGHEPSVPVGSSRSGRRRISTNSRPWPRIRLMTPWNAAWSTALPVSTVPPGRADITTSGSSARI